MIPFTQYFGKAKSMRIKIRSEAETEGRGQITKGPEKTFGGDGNIPHVVVVILYGLIRTPRIVYLYKIHFILCKL